MAATEGFQSFAHTEHAEPAALIDPKDTDEDAEDAAEDAVPQTHRWQKTLRLVIGTSAVAGVLVVAALGAGAWAPAEAGGLPVPRRALLEGEQWLEGLEELHPELAQRLAHPDLQRDLEELRRLGLHSDKMIDLMSRRQARANLSDLREFVAERRRKMQESQSAPNLTLTYASAWKPSKEQVVHDLTCSWHAGQSVLYLVEACLGIRDAVLDCPEVHRSGYAIAGKRRGIEATEACTVDITGLISSFAWTAFMYAAMASQCQDALTPVNVARADCAANVLAMTASLIDMADAGAGVGVDCKGHQLKQTFLRVKNAMKGGPDPGQLDHSSLGHCVINPMQSMYWLMRAAFFIRDAVKVGEECMTTRKEQCAIDSLYVVSSFGWAASFIASAVSTCAEVPNLDALCGEDIIGLVAECATVSASAIALHDGSCLPSTIASREPIAGTVPFVGAAH